MADRPRPVLHLVDGYAQLFRAYHAIRSALTSPVTQEPTNATFGYVAMLLKVLREYRPDYLAVVIDVSGDRETFRSEIYPDYKANRPPPPEDFGPQVERCLSITRMMGIPVLGAEGFEADDVIATIVRRLAEEPDDPPVDIRIVSKDKDLEQLLGPHVALLDVHTDETIDVAALEARKGIRPEQVVDVLALMGDSVDNVPGVPGIGVKTAAKLVGEYGSVEGLLERIDEIRGKRRENLEAARESIALSKDLVTLRRDVDLDFDLDAAAVDLTRLPVDRLLAVLRDLGFSRHQDELRSLVGSDEDGNGNASEAGDTPAARGTLFATTEHAGAEPADDSALAEPKRGEYEIVTREDALDALVTRLEQAQSFAFDTETTSIAPRAAALVGLAFSVEPGRGWYVPVRSPEPETHLDLPTVIDRLRPVLENPERSKIAHNGKYDLVVLRTHGVRLRGLAFDTMVASYLVDSSRSSHAMDALARSLLDYRCIAIRDLLGPAKRGREPRTFADVPLADAAVYAAEDADVTLRLRDALAPELDRLGQRRLFDEVEMPLVQVLADMAYEGIRVDRSVLDEQREALSGRIEALRDEIVEVAPHAFNPDSPRQLAAVLFNKPADDPPGLGLRVTRRGKTGPSTNVEVLEKLAADPEVETPIPRLIVEHRQLAKLVNTYLVALGECIHPDTGRIHASFNQTVAATGRLSSSDPNLQNIPIRTDVGRRIRRAFVADPGHRLLTADYSQIELRILAHLSEDEGLREAFRAGRDIHTAVAAEVFGVEPEDVTRTQRGSAKMVNFGIVYGITAFGLARRLGDGTTNEQAARIIADYKARYPRIETFLHECVEQARDHGFVETILGRRRPVPQVASRRPQERALGERMAINSVVQGSAADLIKVAMVRLHDRMPDDLPGTRLLLQIHDELVLEVPEADVDHARAIVRDTMENAMDLAVPLLVEAAVSATWLEAK